MPSKIYDEISTAKDFGYKWDADKDRPANILACLSSTDDMQDKQFKALSQEARDFIDHVYSELDAKRPCPEFPDYVEAAPARRRRAPAKDAEAEKEAEPAPTRRRRSPAKDAEPEKADEPAKEAEPDEVYTKEVATEDKPAKAKRKGTRGQNMFIYRKTVLENTGLSKPDAYEMATKAGCDMAKSTADLVYYNTHHTLKVLKELGHYDHGSHASTVD